LIECGLIDFQGAKFMVPLRGQGKPLPDDCPYKGEWLIENKMFLYRPKTSERSKVEMIPIFESPNGEWCFGFNAETMAAQLGVGSDEIFVHNRNRTLILVGVAEVPPVGGGAAAMGYRFPIGDRTADFRIETGPEGTA
jgi:hypothetical protein